MLSNHRSSQQAPRFLQPGEAPTPPLATLLILSIAVIVWELLYPFNFQPHRQTTWMADWHIPKLNSFGNIALFMPFGCAATWWLRHRKGRLAAPGTLAIISAAALLSLLGETAQMWLPQRYSAPVDLLANIVGAAVGMGLGLLFENQFIDQWTAFSDWSSRRPFARRALYVTAAVLILKTAPFDISPETFYLKWGLYRSIDAGGPFSAVTQWWATPQPDPQLQLAATQQLTYGTINLLLLAAATFSIGQAVRESMSRSGVQKYPLPALCTLGVALALAAEFLQWPIRSRLMDATDTVAGLCGALLGALANWASHRLLILSPTRP